MYMADRAIGGEGTLQEKLQKANQQLHSMIEAYQTEGQQPATKNVNCVKCKKTCKSRGAYCELNDHWIHYKCDKLSEKEITSINEESSAYVCSMCIPGRDYRAIANIDESINLATQVQNMFDGTSTPLAAQESQASWYSTCTRTDDNSY